MWSFVLSQDCFGYLGSFAVPYEFYDFFSISVKKNHIGIDRNWTEPTDGFGYYGQFNNIKSVDEYIQMNKWMKQWENDLMQGSQTSGV